MAIDLTKVFNTIKDKTGFPTALFSTNADKIMAFAEQIYDLNRNEYQAVLNDDIYVKIKSLSEDTFATINGIEIKKNSNVTIINEMTNDEIDKMVNEVFYNK